MPPHPTSPLVAMSATELAARIRRREVSSREVMTTYLDHIERINPAVNAVVSLQPRDMLLAAADDADAEIARGEIRSWMHGLPHAVKDLVFTKGIRTTSGSPIFESFVPSFDAIFVERLRAGGAIIIGKTNTPELGLGSQTYNPIFGTTGNAYDPTKTAGRQQWRRRGGLGAVHAAGRRRQRLRGLAAQPRRMEQHLRFSSERRSGASRPDAGAVHAVDRLRRPDGPYSGRRCHAALPGVMRHDSGSTASSQKTGGSNYTRARN